MGLRTSKPVLEGRVEARMILSSARLRIAGPHALVLLLERWIEAGAILMSEGVGVGGAEQAEHLEPMFGRRVEEGKSAAAVTSDRLIFS